MIEVVRAGAGPMLGYVHGPLGTPAAHPFVAALAGAGRTVVAPNLPGFQGSAPAVTRTLHDWVFHASIAVDESGLAGAPMVAASTGAMVACELAALRPDVFASLVLLSPLGLWDPESPVHDLWSERTPRQPRWLLEDPRSASAFYDDEPGASPEALMDSEVRRYRTRTSAASLMWPLPEFGLAERLHRVSVPVAVVWGREDRLMGPSYRDLWANTLANFIGSREIDGAGHLVEWDAPMAVAEAVMGFTSG